ncbi:hypothetical protein [Pseudomonas fluorescens]|uniref:hypothetical protein n=1 Tax=Pseudomonas fluorescens TaxID=294 RepID=UPI001A9CD01E|nr:hypothetical protein [Pseudomonas fluorescens]QTD35838.1 hypothetical protein JZM58_13555 [Pseudomonas fluorescens]
MMEKLEWIEIVKNLSHEFPLIHDDFPMLSVAIDDEVDDILRESLTNPSEVDAHYVEDLLTDCVNRISSCLTLREKAQDIEARAISDAINYKALKAANEVAKLTAIELAPLQEKMIQNATSIEVSETSGKKTVNFSSDNKTWSNIENIQETFLQKQLEIAEIMKTKASTPGNGANHIERFLFIKRLFDISIEEAYKRSLVCAKSLKSLYGIQLDVPKISKHGYLNELAIWAQTATTLLDSELDSRIYSKVAFAISARDENPKETELIPKSKFTASIATRAIGFTLTSAHFEKFRMKSVLLRSIRIQVRAKDESRTRVWSVTVKLPNDGLGKTDASYPCVAPSNYQGPDENLSIVHGIHNFSPVGDWQINLPERSITDDDTSPAEILNIYLFLDVSARRI